MTTDRVLNEREIAVELGISPWTVRRLRLQLGMPHFRTAGRIFYRLGTVTEWMAEQERASTKCKSESKNYGKIRRLY